MVLRLLQYEKPKPLYTIRNAPEHIFFGMGPLYANHYNKSHRWFNPIDTITNINNGATDGSGYSPGDGLKRGCSEI